MNVYCAKNVSLTYPDGERILAFGAVLRPSTMPDVIADHIAGWAMAISPPTTSKSIYDTTEKTWTHTPVGSHRAGDHWGWADKRSPGGLACPTDVPVEPDSWAIGRWDGQRYVIVMQAKKTGPNFRASIKAMQSSLFMVPGYRIDEEEFRRFSVRRANALFDQAIGFLAFAGEFQDHLGFKVGCRALARLRESNSRGRWERVKKIAYPRSTL